MYPENRMQAGNSNLQAKLSCYINQKQEYIVSHRLTMYLYQYRSSFIRCPPKEQTLFLHYCEKN